MIETLDGFPDNVVAVAARERITRQDYLDVLIPKVDAALARGGKVRLYYEIGADMTGVDAGAAWEDFRLGVEHLSRWERMAVVTDIEWISRTINVFRIFMPGQLRVFPLSEAEAARRWIVAA